MYRHAQATPIFSINSAVKASGLSFPTAAGAVERLVDAGIFEETSGRQRGRLFVYSKYMDLLNEE